MADKQQITWKIGEVPSGSSDSESYNFPRMLFMLRRLLINLYNHNYVRVSVQSRNASFKIFSGVSKFFCVAVGKNTIALQFVCHSDLYL